MSDSGVPFRELIIATKDGDWGESVPGEDTVPYRVIRGADFPRARVGDLSEVPLRFLRADTVGRRTLEPNDVIIETAGGSHDRPTGRTLLITARMLDGLDSPATCASFCRFLRVDCKKIDPRYLYWYLQNIYQQGAMWEHQVQHTGIARFQFTKFAESLQVPLPTYVEQEAIAQVLGALDDKIELNRRMNQTLEAMARAIFKAWFVDFEPASDGRPWTQGGGNIGQLARIQKESLTPADHADEPFSHYSIPAFDEGMIPRLEAGDSIRSNKFAVPRGAVLLSKLNPRIPRVWLPTPSKESRAICSTEFLVVVPIEAPDREFLYSLFSSPEFMDRFASRTTGTSGSHQRVMPEDLLRMDIAIPIAAARERYSTTVGPLLSKVAQNREESQTLAALRNTLLPKLLSGEIRVKQAEKIVSDTASP